MRGPVLSDVALRDIGATAGDRVSGGRVGHVAGPVPPAARLRPAPLARIGRVAGLASFPRAPAVVLAAVLVRAVALPAVAVLIAVAAVGGAIAASALLIVAHLVGVRGPRAL